MYIVTITNGDIATAIHDGKSHLASGQVIKGINTIDSFTFSMYPNNPGFGLINEFTTLVHVYNTNKARYDFIGRVLYSETTMDEDGSIAQSVTCENVLGYLCDSVQTYVDTQNWTVREMFEQLIGCHNSQVEGYKHFKIGSITAEDKNDNLYQGIQRENTWDAIQSKLIDKIGGELQVRFEEDGMYLDYLSQIGELKETEIALSVNMKSITREQDPTAFVTRLIPLGSKLKLEVEVTDDEGNKTKETVETEQRVDITSVTENGENYIDDAEAIAVYGIHVGVVEWDDVTDPSILHTKGEAWLKSNNAVQVKYSVGTIDLSLIGLAIDDLDVGNYHPIKNALIYVDDTARIIKKNINVCEEIESTIEIGDNIKSLSDIQREQSAKLAQSANKISEAATSANNLALSINKRLTALENKVLGNEETFSSEIEQVYNSISLEVNGSLGSNASVILTAGKNQYSGEFDLSQVREAFANDNTAVSISAGLITFNAGTLIINSSKFTLDSSGKITATDAVIHGDIITIDGSYKTEMDKGSLRLYYGDVLCGTINTKYWSGASTEGISLRVEEGGNYIMFSHADDTQGSGYVVDYYLNAGWSSNYDEMHIFQTSARFLSDAYFAGKTRIRSLRLFDGSGEYLVGINNGQLTVSEL